MSRKRGQISVEYLIIVGMVGFLVISMLGLAFYYSGNVKDQIKMNQLNNFANKLISSGENVFFSGEPSRVTVVGYMPEGVKVINVVDNGKSLYFEISTNSGINVITFPSNVNMEFDDLDGDGNSGITIHQGSKRIRIVASSDLGSGVGGVRIDQV